MAKPGIFRRGIHAAVHADEEFTARFSTSCAPLASRHDPTRLYRNPRKLANARPRRPKHPGINNKCAIALASGNLKRNHVPYEMRRRHTVTLGRSGVAVGLDRLGLAIVGVILT